MFQLNAQGALDRFEEVLEEVPKVREDLGYPPLVTPMSQIVGTTSVFNILLGERYKMVPTETKLCKGSLWETSSTIKEEIRKNHWR